MSWACDRKKHGKMYSVVYINSCDVVNMLVILLLLTWELLVQSQPWQKYQINLWVTTETRISWNSEKSFNYCHSDAIAMTSVVVGMLRTIFKNEPYSRFPHKKSYAIQGKSLLLPTWWTFRAFNGMPGWR